MKTRAFRQPGPLALAAYAFGQEFAPASDAPEIAQTEIPRIYVRGPLLHHPELTDPQVPWGSPKWFLSYDELKFRAEHVIQNTASRDVLLILDSPGGVATGFIDCAREIRELAQRCGKRIIAFVEGNACSAAYGMALAADEIWVSESSRIGSIGVIEALRDQSSKDSSDGYRWTLITSGARKADGNPHVAVSEDAIKAQQELVDGLAEVFFAFVAERRGVSVDTVRSWQASTFTAQQAHAIGLVDGVTTLDKLLAQLAAAETPTTVGGNAMTRVDAAKAALKAIVDGDGDDQEKERARKALAAFEDKPEGKAEDDKTEDKPEGKGKAEGEDDKPEDKPEGKGKAEGEDDKPEGKASAAAAASDYAARLAQLEQRQEATERAAIYATRPDLTKEQIAALDKLPVSALSEFIATLPRLATNPVAAARAALNVAPTQGGEPKTGKLEATRFSAHADELDRLMGISTGAQGVRVEGNRLVLSAGRATEAK